MKMLTDRKVFFSSFLLATLSIIFFASVSLAGATHHIIQFGGQFGPNYSPNQLDVVVGDTIIWQANDLQNGFSTYDLDTVPGAPFPVGATPFPHTTAGTSFTYIIQVPGEYDYQSDTWVGLKMKGTIIAVGIHNGLTNEGREFFMGMIYPNYNVGKTEFFHVYGMINTYYANEVTVNYYDPSGNPILEKTYRLPAKSSIKLPLDTQFMRADTSSDNPAYNSCHIVSKYPITVEYVSVGQCSGGSYLALPAISVGKKYVAASYNDNPGNYAFSNPNNSGGAIMIIGTVDGTTVNIIPTTTTTTGHIGAIHGLGTNQTPVPYSKGLNKGQTYFLHSPGDDIENDMSGSIIESNFPVVVLSGQENASIGGTDPYSIEGRDFMVEQMVPYELWDSAGYISIPFVEPAGYGDVGHGDKYRTYTYDNGTAPVSFNGSDLEYSSRFHFAAPGGQQELDITQPMEINSTNGTKISVMQYDERSQPKNKPWPAPSMMTVVPRSHWKQYFSLTALDNGDITHVVDMPYINVIGDHLDDITVTYGTNVMVPLSSLTKVTSFSNASVSDGSVIGEQYKLTAPVYTPSVAYNFFSHYPFMIYYYEMRIVSDVNLGLAAPPNIPQEYAAPAGMALNTGVEPQFTLTIDSTTQCASWHITVNDALDTNDPGIKTIMLVTDPDGMYFLPGAAAQNAAFDTTVQGYTMGEFHPLLNKPTDNFSFTVNVTDPLQAAIAPLAIIDNKGNAKYFMLRYKAPLLSLSLSQLTAARADSVVFPIQKVGDKVCSTFVLKNTDVLGGKPITINSASLTNPNEPAYVISQISHTIPFQIMPGDSLTISLCYSANDTLRHRDSLRLGTDCFGFYISLDAHGQTGLIYADDEDFGYASIGQASCRDILVKNVGNAPLKITGLSLSDDSDFSVSSKTKSMLPITLKGGASTTLNICFIPHAEAPYSEELTITTDLGGSFANEIKSYSYLTGIGVNFNAVAYHESPSTDALKLYPNPANGNSIEVTFATPPAKRSVLSIRDVLGRELYRKDIEAGIGVTGLPITNMPTGMYYVQLASEDGVQTQKLEVVR